MDILKIARFHAMQQAFSGLEMIFQGDLNKRLRRMQDDR